ncbi:MAG: hypothetical protein E6326_23790, partial [Enterobacter roggenkampii]|nr:hypothetical protein [Enterobacter roggenkampii]
DVFAGKKSAQIREILISESAWEEMTCLFAPSLIVALITGYLESFSVIHWPRRRSRFHYWHRSRVQR